MEQTNFEMAQAMEVEFESMEREPNHRREAMVSCSSPGTSAPSKELDRFQVLGEDAILTIFSFAGHAPLEKIASNPGASELAQSIPAVSKFWRTMSEHDSLWKPAILRQLQREPNLWAEGLLKMVQRKKSGCHFVLEDDETPESFLDRVRGALGNASYKKIYRNVVSKHIRQVLPVFYMPGHILLGGSYRLHMFEPRYRLLVAELLKGYPEEARQGGNTASGDRPAPIFIHANRQPLGPDNPACLVQLIRCNVSPRDGTVDAMLLPIAYVWLEKIWVRSKSGNLHYAQCIRMGQKATREMHKLVNQETLESVISRMGDYLTDDEDEDFEEDDDEFFDDDDHFRDIWE
jgi:hypothetical protein